MQHCAKCCVFNPVKISTGSFPSEAFLVYIFAFFLYHSNYYMFMELLYMVSVSCMRLQLLESRDCLNWVSSVGSIDWVPICCTQPRLRCILNEHIKISKCLLN